MPLTYDIWLLLISLLAATVTIVISFGFLDRVYRSSEKVKGLLPMCVAFAIGSGVLMNHFLVLSATNIGAPAHISWALVHAWLCATGIGACFVYIPARKNSKLRFVLLGGIVSGLCDFGLFFSSRIAIHGLEVIHINPLMAIVGTVFSMVVITLALLQFQWVKTYAGPYRMAVRTAVALGVALAIASIHFVFDAAFYEASIGLIDVNTNSKITAIAVALGMVCLFLIAFMLVLFYEKHGKQLFNLNLFQSSPDKKVKEYSLQDSLTKLPNRRAFDSHLESAEKRCARSGKSFALAYIDLDHSTIGAFKAPIFVSAPFRAIHPRELCLSLSLLSSSPSQNFHHHTIKS